MKPICRLFKAISLTILLGISSMAFAMTTYTVQRGDSLWRVATQNQVNGVSNSNMVKAIKGINAAESHGIMDDVINIGQRLAIPTSKSEVQDGLKLYDARMNPFAQPIQPVTAPAEPTPTATEQSTTDTTPPTVPDRIEPMTQPTTLTSDNIATQNPEISTAQSSSGWFMTILWVVLFVGLTIFIARRRHKKRNTIAENTNVYQPKVAPSVTSYESQTFNINPLNSTPQVEEKPEIISTDELLRQVEGYILENDTTQAKFLLQQAINYKMRDLPIYIKLLEVYAIEGDIISFNSQRDYLLANVIPYDNDAWREIDRIYNQYLSKHH